MVKGHLSARKPLFLHPVVKGFDLELFRFTGNSADGGWRRRSCRRSSEPSDVAVQQLFETLVGFRRQQNPSRFEKVEIAFDFPERPIQGNPLRCKRSRVIFFRFGEVLFGKAVANAQIGVSGQKAEVRKRVYVRPFVIAPVELSLREIWCISRRFVFPSRLALSGKPLPQSRASPIRVSM